MSDGQLFLPSVNLADTDAASGFDYEPGTYILEIKALQVATNQDGQNQRLKVINTIICGPGQSDKHAGKQITNSYQLTTKGAPFLKRLVLACGYSEEQVNSYGPNWDYNWIIGKQYMCRVTRQPQPDGRVFTNVGNEKPLSEWAAEVGPTPAGAPSAPPAMAAPAPVAAPPTMAPPPVAAPAVAPPVAAPPVAAPMPAGVPAPGGLPVAPPAPPARPVG